METKLAAMGGDGAAHVAGDSHEAVDIWNLSVLIVPDEDCWFAQGLEINYGAQGSTIEDAKENFQAGLLATIHQHLKVHKSIERILKFAPSQILKEAAANKGSIQKFTQVSLHGILEESALKVIPFDGIEYRVLQAAA